MNRKAESYIEAAQDTLTTKTKVRREGKEGIMKRRRG
jgi:hypothetical protein